MIGNISSSTLSIVTWLMFFWTLSCQTKKENITSPDRPVSDSLAKAMAVPIKPEPVAPPVLDTVSIFKQVLRNKGKDYNYKNDTIEIKYGNVFSKKQKHLFVKFENIFEYSMEFSIFCLKKGRFVRIFKYSIGLNPYQGVCLFDVNGDNYKDLVVFWHPGSGGADSYYVFLCKKGSSFTEAYDFIEPIECYPNSKTILGKDFGEYAPYYKFHWKSNYTLDTIEFIYPPGENIYDQYSNSHIPTDSIHYYKIDYTKNKKVTLLDSLPSYYFNQEAAKRQKALFEKLMVPK